MKREDILNTRSKIYIFNFFAFILFVLAAIFLFGFYDIYEGIFTVVFLLTLYSAHMTAQKFLRYHKIEEFRIRNRMSKVEFNESILRGFIDYIEHD